MPNNSKSTDWTKLYLLSDSSYTQPAPAFSAWQEMFRKHTQFLKGSRVSTTVKTAAATMKKTAPVIAKESTKKPLLPAGRTNQIFRSGPDLRELMRQYNRRTPTRGLIKSIPRQAAYGEFRTSPVEMIEIPTIPGKILRPAT